MLFGCLALELDSVHDSTVKERDCPNSTANSLAFPCRRSSKDGKKKKKKSDKDKKNTRRRRAERGRESV